MPETGQNADNSGTAPIDSPAASSSGAGVAFRYSFALPANRVAPASNWHSLDVSGWGVDYHGGRDHPSGQHYFQPTPRINCAGHARAV